ncbi:MAG: transketolase [bacterium]
MEQTKKFNEEELRELESISKNLRKRALTMVYKAQSGHPGGALSSIDLLLILYKKIMKLSPQWKEDNEWKKRDRFILSKGHASAALYSVLCEFGYFCPTEIDNFRQLGAKLQGHPNNEYVQGVEVPSGSLGQGLSLANGIALSLKLDKNPAKVFVLLGDGELQEGQIWEAAMTSNHYKLNNLVAIIDRNRLQIDGDTEDVMGLEPLADKWRAFGWEVIETNGHDYQEIYEAYQKASLLGSQKASPVVIIANTIKGKGVSFMENNAGWHGKAPSEDEFNRAIDELKSV